MNWLLQSLKDLLAGVSVLTGVAGFFLTVNGELQYATGFAAFATALGIYGSLYHATNDEQTQLSITLSILPVIGLTTLILPARIGLPTVSLLLVAGGIGLSFSHK